MINWLKGPGASGSSLHSSFELAVGEGKGPFSGYLESLVALSPIHGTGRRQRDVRIDSPDDFAGLVEALSGAMQSVPRGKRPGERDRKLSPPAPGSWKSGWRTSWRAGDDKCPMAPRASALGPGRSSAVIGPGHMSVVWVEWECNQPHISGRKPLVLLRNVSPGRWVGLRIPRRVRMDSQRRSARYFAMTQGAGAATAGRTLQQGYCPSCPDTPLLSARQLRGGICGCCKTRWSQTAGGRYIAEWIGSYLQPV
jgi:hypothetical protein